MHEDLPKAARKYLERGAEPEAALAQKLGEKGGVYAGVLVIPSCGEYETLERTLSTLPRCREGRALVVLVVNERGDSAAWVHEANRKMLEALLSRLERGWAGSALGPGAQHYRAPDNDLLVIDRTGRRRRLPLGQGVGLARKIGADLALALWAQGALLSPWIHCSDADVALPPDYFDRALGRTTPAALLYDFRHGLEDAHDGGSAILEYEIFLRYYVLGLRSAGSRYAYHSIGSTIAVHAESYAEVRGFPRRQAAEDFHLLAKLAKVGAIEPLRGEAIVLSARVSDRVPFGTGHAMSRARERVREGARGSLFVYDPRSFACLSLWLKTLDSLAEDPNRGVEDTLHHHAQQVGTVASPRLAEILEDQGVLSGVRETLRRPRRDLERALHERFDALATLRLIHALRDQLHPDLPLAEALASAPFLDVPDTASLREVRRFLAKAEN